MGYFALPRLELEGKHRSISLEWNNVIPYGKILVRISDSVVLGVLQSFAVSWADIGR